MLLPDKCSVREKGRDCVNPPEFVVSIVSSDGEYMVGVTCQRHKGVVSKKVNALQEQDVLLKGKLNFEPLKAVGTDCINAKPDDLIRL